MYCWQEIPAKSYHWLYKDKKGIQVPDPWDLRVLTRAGWPWVCTMLLGKIASLICCFYVSVAWQCVVCSEHIHPRATVTVSMLLGHSATVDKTGPCDLCNSELSAVVYSCHQHVMLPSRNNQTLTMVYFCHQHTIELCKKNQTLTS